MSTTTAACLERLEQIQDNVHNRLDEDPHACVANVSIDGLIDLVRALAERVDSLQQDAANHHHVVSAAIRRHRDTEWHERGAS